MILSRIETSDQFPSEKHLSGDVTERSGAPTLQSARCQLDLGVDSPKMIEVRQAGILGVRDHLMKTIELWPKSLKMDSPITLGEKILLVSLEAKVVMYLCVPVLIIGCLVNSYWFNKP